jgi:transposase-like protein
MSKRTPYPPEFRSRMIVLVRSGRSPEDLAKEFEPSGQTIRNWVQQADRDDGLRHDGLTSQEWDELRKLRRECLPAWNIDPLEGKISVENCNRSQGQLLAS